MSENSKIQWTHHTFNPWRGCTKVSAECDHCYAEQMSGRNPSVLGVWGKYGSRVVASTSYWKEPIKWDKKAGMAEERRRVFCASLADVFEGDESMPADVVHDVNVARLCLGNLIRETLNLDWLLLTKRPQNIERISKGILGFYDTLPDNVWIGTSVGVQKTKPRIDTLRAIPAAVRFLSIEPLLEDLGKLDLTNIDWVIVGGESGGKARPCDIAWIRRIVDQCKERNISVFVKQLGTQPVQPFYYADCGKARLNLKDRKGGDIDEWPEDLRIREFPNGGKR